MALSDKVVDISNYQSRTDGKTAQNLAQGMDYDEFGIIVDEIRNQPNWRDEADRCADYYDGNQLDGDTLEALNAKGMGPLKTNLVKPSIDVVLGIEAKQRSDWRVTCDTDEYQDVAEALSQSLSEVERLSRADRACSDAYAGQVKSGLGWVEVSKNADPFKYPYRVTSIHRREIYWDWTAKEPDLADARYLLRKRWFDLNHVLMYYPDQADILKGAVNRWQGDLLDITSDRTDLAQAINIERAAGFEDYEWLNTYRNRVCLFEMYYRIYVRGTVIQLRTGKVVEFDQKNPVHVAAINTGVVRPFEATYSKLRRSVWAGPHKLTDVDWPYKTFPYIPFFGYREDLTNVPYGLIRSMIDPQDEINARRQKLMWLLSSKRLIMDADALDLKSNDVNRVLEEIARPDAVVVLNPSRRNAHGFAVESDLALAAQQFEVLQDAKRSLQDAAGIYQSMLGKAETGASSGVAISSLVEQGMTTLGEIGDNYRYSRRMVGDSLLELIRNDIGNKQIAVSTGTGKVKRQIILNNPVQDQETGMVYLQNDVQRAELKVALEDIPQTPAYKNQMLLMMGEVIKSMPPQAQGILAPVMLELTELPNREVMAEQLRMVLGLHEITNADNPEAERLNAELQQAQQIIQQLQSDPKAKRDMASAAKDMAEAQKIVVETELMKLDAKLAGMDAEDPMRNSVQDTMMQGEPMDSEDQAEAMQGGQREE